VDLLVESIPFNELSKLEEYFIQNRGRGPELCRGALCIDKRTTIGKREGVDKLKLQRTDAQNANTHKVTTVIQQISSSERLTRDKTS